jgi:hypothetical protein
MIVRFQSYTLPDLQVSDPRGVLTSGDGILTSIFFREKALVWQLSTANLSNAAYERYIVK